MDEDSVPAIVVQRTGRSLGGQRVDDTDAEDSSDRDNETADRPGSTVGTDAGSNRFPPRLTDCTGTMSEPIPAKCSTASMTQAVSA